MPPFQGPDADPPRHASGRLLPALVAVAAVAVLAASFAGTHAFARGATRAAALAAAAFAAALWVASRPARRARADSPARPGEEAVRLRELTEERDAAMVEQMRLFDQIAGMQLDTANAERRLALALQSANLGVWEYDLKRGSGYFSPGFRERLGIETGSFSGDVEWFGDYVHPEDLDAWRAAVRDHLEHRASYALDVRLRVAAGGYRLFRVRGQAEWNVAGQPVRSSGSLQDITERRFTERRLRESEESFRSLSAASPVGILKADALGECVWCNERWEELSGLSEFEALGAGWLGLVHADDLPAVSRAWGAFVQGEGSFDEEFRTRREGGDPGFARARANAVRDGGGGVSAFVVTVEDVTEERRAALALADARDRAMQAAQAKSEFLANMSHEIRTPLNGVVGMTELLRGTALDEQQLDFVQTISTSADSLLGIINDILDFSKIEAGKMQLEHVEMDLRTIAEDVAELLSPLAAERGLELVVAIGADVPRPLIGDPVRVRQVLSNLAANALKFTERGEVVIAAGCLSREADRCQLRVSVRDTGIGIPPDRLAAVFESFTQADGSTTRKYGGTGLGLTICRQLARLMGGSIHVTSEPGHGSEFWIEIPMGIGTGGAAVPEHAVTLANLRALVVDDHAVNRRILGETLAGWGMRVDVVERGVDALARVVLEGDDPYELVLLDHQMPGMDGLETAARMRGLPGGSGRAVLVLSSHASVLPADRHEQHGVCQWLTKPVRERALRRAVTSALGRPAAPPAVIPFEAPVREFARLSILLVEDNEVNRKVALHMLQRLGCEAEVAVNGREAVERSSARDYDLVLMDCQMPEMDGFEATREIRRRELGTACHVRIVAMTANALEGDRERCLACGMDDYVAKPVKLEALSGQLRLAGAKRPAA